MWATRRWVARVVPDDPLAVAAALDLLAACLQAGLAVPDAAVAAAQVCDPVALNSAGLARDTAARGGHFGAAPRLATALRRVADLLSLGGDPADAWEVLAAEKGLEPMARLARRSADSGASLASEAGRLADDFRTRAADSAVASAEKAGVAIAGPLGVCFLPAFVCLGIAPVIVGLAGDILGGGLGAP
ncbi:type II secretion system F family protein [Tomitella fengzijianii]|uniref:Type II secretion system F family protein n=1 Tax=Tomitella fengzijianii TaxID=2597660 RepID=A0A516X7C2_9ACTN|nr:type II secretion system F family protein [Tomitella fengzijianii]